MTDGFVRVTGADRLIAAFTGLVAEADRAALTIVRRSQAVVNREIKTGFHGSHRKGQPTTSAPGEPPDVVTGTLRRSVMSTTPQRLVGGASGKVYPTAIYARIQELGGQTTRGFLPPRPFVAPAYQRALPQLRLIAVEEWAKIRA